MSTAFLVSSLLLNIVSNSAAQTFLIASDTGVQTFSANVATPTTLHSLPASAIHYRYNKDVYFISGNQIMYSYFRMATKSYASPVPVVSLANNLTDLVVDWVHFRLYFTDGTGILYSAALLGSSPTQVYKAGHLQDLAIDPYDRLLFFIEDGELVSLGMDTLRTYHYTLASTPLSRVTRVAVFPHSREVYVVGHDSTGGQQHLVATDYQDKEARLVFSGVQLVGVVALDVCGDQVAWAGYTKDEYILYSCRMSPDCHTDDLNVISQSHEVIHDVKFFSELAHSPSEDVACSLLNCSHNCSVVSAYSVRCTCPEGMAVEADDNVCRVVLLPPRERSPLQWPLVVLNLLVLVSETLFQWFTSTPSHARTLIVICCALMACLALCGLCVLMAARKPRRRVRHNECYRLSERYRSAPSTQPYRPNIVIQRKK